MSMNEYTKFTELDQENKEIINNKISELRNASPPTTYNDVIKLIRNQYRVNVTRNNVYFAAMNGNGNGRKAESDNNRVIKRTAVKKKVAYDPEDIQNIDEPEIPFTIEELVESIYWGTRKIKLILNENSVLFYIINLSESKRYGTKTTIKLDDDKGKCNKAILSLTDNIIFPAGSEFNGKGRVTKKELEKGINEKIITKSISGGLKGSITIDEDGDLVKRREIKAFDEEDNELEVQKSSLHLKNSPAEVELTESISLDDVLDHDVNTRYILIPVEEDNDTQFKTSLKQMEESNDPCFPAFQFSYFDGWDPKDAFIQLFADRGNEYILLCAGDKLDTQFVGIEKLPDEAVEIEEDFELDFSL